MLEIGPDPGLTTRVLARVAPELNAIEIDPKLPKTAHAHMPAAHT